MKTINKYISATERISSIDDYINEKLVIGNNLEGYHYHPKDKNELIKCIYEKIDKEGLGTKDKPLNLNDIDTSEITDMSDLFNANNGDLIELSDNGYFDISDWDVSNVKSMRKMFMDSSFTGDISKWDVSNVEDMHWMFRRSKFDGDLSAWNVSKVKNMSGMFYDSDFNGNLYKWNVSNVKDMSGMFTGCTLKYYNTPPSWYHE